MKRLRLLLLLPCFCYTVLFSQQIQYTKYDLPNGLKVILHEDHSTPIVAVSVMYHVGAKNEKPERTGFAHFFEHLLFEGSDNIKRGEFDSYVSNAGGMMNANTSYDRTYYYEVLPSNQLALGLWLESERMLHAKVEIEGIETQRKVVKEERRQRIDNRPYGRLRDETMKRLFKIHPYHNSIIGSMEHLDAAQDIDYQQFYKDFYRPDNAILSIAGDIDPAQTKELVALYFKDATKGTTEIYRPKIAEPPIIKEIRDTVYDNVKLPAVVYGFQIPALGTPDFYAVKMLGMLLSNGESSRLNKRLVDQLQIAAQIGATPLNLEDPGANLIFALANKGIELPVIEKQVDSILTDIQTNLISDRELQRVSNQVENDFASSNAKVIGIAESLANYEMYYGDANLINTELERYRKVTREDIRRVANKYFAKSSRVVLYWLPLKTP